MAKDPKATIAYWERHPESFAARTYARMVAGEWVTSADAVAEGINGSNVSQVVAVLHKAGLPVETKSAGYSNAKTYRLRPRRGTRVDREVQGVTHPALGAVLTVRALALDAAGDLTVHLSNGNGAGWVATITGHVGP